MTRVSEHFALGVTQPQLDFVDVRLDADTPVFIDPRAMTLLDTEWGKDCVALIADYFGCVLHAIKDGDRARADRLLGQLHEPNETRLGLSRGAPRGHALGAELARRLRVALEGSEAVRSGLLEDLEDTILMIDGISSDLISDISTNVIRQPLTRYTQQACEDLGIPMAAAAYPGGPFWDPGAEEWRQDLAQLPVVDGKPLVLVPKVLVRRRMDYDADEYYNGYLIPFLRNQEIEGSSDLVRVIKKTGLPTVDRKDLVRKYGRGKSVNARLSKAHPQLLTSYRDEKRRHVRPPLDHAEMAEVTGTALPDFDGLLAAVRAVKPGNAGATAYHRAVEALLTALLYPWLSMPKREVPIHGGRKRIDITFVNNAADGFFSWLGKHYDAPYVMVECKNYAGDPENPELDQLAGRFSPRRGTVGILVCRSITDREVFTARCRDTADDGRGYIVALSDEDLVALVGARRTGDDPGMLGLLRERFNELVL